MKIKITTKYYFTSLLFFHICALAYTVGESDARIAAPSLYANQQQIEKKATQISNNFKYIQPNGQVHTSYTGDIEDLVTKFSPDIKNISTSSFYLKEFSITKISRGQIPSIQMKDNVNWKRNPILSSESTALGEDFSALGFKTQEVLYYRYSGENPLFAPSSFYNDMIYTTLDGETENVLDRFYFYRWTGKNMGIDLDTYMFAIDTYTGLVFTYVKISSWKGAFGVEIPTRYEPIDIFKSENGRPYLFFEYDPVGYISRDGKLILHDWYIEKTKKKLQVQLKNHLPVGNSPYYVQ